MCGTKYLCIQQKSLVGFFYFLKNTKKYRSPKPAWGKIVKYPTRNNDNKNAADITCANCNFSRTRRNLFLKGQHFMQLNSEKQCCKSESVQNRNFICRIRPLVCTIHTVEESHES